MSSITPASTSEQPGKDRSVTPPSDNGALWHAMEIEEVLRVRNAQTDGLTDAAVAARQKEFGLNRIDEEKAVSGWEILFRQLKGFFNLVLYAAAIISFVFHKLPDAVFICAILVLNTGLAFFQEYKASRAMAALKNFLVEKVKVLRNSVPVEVEVTDLVPGDIVDLGEGEKVPADGRLMEAHALSIDEAVLTGESVPAEKDARKVDRDTDLGDRTGMAYAGTTVVRGTGRAVVVETGMHTELGRIAQALQETQAPPTRFEVEVEKLSKNITFVILGMVVVVAAVLFLRHSMAWNDIIIFALSLGVGAIPESLPVVLSFALACGAQQMAVRKALARRLAIVESLGSVDVICSDKTGTLTKNEMTAQGVYVPGHDPYFVTGEGYDPASGSIQFHSKEKSHIQLDNFLRGLALCNDVQKTVKDGETVYLGDPTEIALVVLAEKAGVDVEKLRAEFSRMDEIPFTSDRQRMTTVHHINGKRIAICKGGPEVITERCSHVNVRREQVPFTQEERDRARRVQDRFQENALRVLGMAIKEAPEGVSGEDMEKDMVFLGIVGMIDPPRPEAKQAIAHAHQAGIKTVMITGDHIATARAIGARLNMDQNAVTGRDVEAMSDDELNRKVDDIDIVARATPIVKLRVLKALQYNHHLAAMTGDGVNDSPAVKQADVGIAMGLRGTDAAKEAAGLVLLDDNFATIVSAIEEGRRIFDNIRKFVNYLLTCNIGEVLTILLGALIMGQPVLTAIMILWVNILTDVFPAVSLGIDPGNPGLLNRKPRKHDEPILNRPLIWMTVILGLKKGIENFLVFVVGYYWIFYWDFHRFLNRAADGTLQMIVDTPVAQKYWIHRGLLTVNDTLVYTGEVLQQHLEAIHLEYAQTMAFTGIVVYAFVRIFVIRTFDTLSIWANPWLLISLGFASLMQLFIIYCPDVNDFLGLDVLRWGAWLVLGILAVWANVTGVWVSKRVEKWFGPVIDTSGAGGSLERGGGSRE